MVTKMHGEILTKLKIIKRDSITSRRSNCENQIFNHFTADDQHAPHVRNSQKQKRHAKRNVAQPAGKLRIELEEQAAVDLTQVTLENASEKGKSQDN